jgi:hypothetical protein
MNFVRTDLSEEHITSIFMVEKYSELRTALVVTIRLIILALKMEAIRSSEVSVQTTAILRHIPGDGIFLGVCTFL